MSRGGRFEELEFTVAGRPRRAALWLPPGYDGARAWPLVVFLHGLGERGDALEHLSVGLGPALAAHPDRYPCVVLMPQCPEDLVWVSIDRAWANGRRDAEAHVDAAIAAALGSACLDPARVALTGLSMGGFGVFVYGAKRIERFQSLVAVCGGGYPADGPRLAERPLWVLHGDADEVVDVEESRRMVRAVDAAGGGGVLRVTEYRGVGHACWDHAYAEPEVPRFLVDPPRRR